MKKIKIYKWIFCNFSKNFLGTVFVILEDLFDTQTIDQCTQMFKVIEERANSFSNVSSMNFPWIFQFPAKTKIFI